MPSGASELRTCERTVVPWDLQKLWLGHANKDVTDRYAEQLKEDVQWFKLPSVESSVGLLGLPKQQKSQLQKVA